MTLVERFSAAVAARDHAALHELLAEAPQAPDRELASLALETARAIPNELVALRLVVYDIAMSATDASKHAFNNALNFLGMNPTAPEITPDLIAAWLARGTPHGPGNPYIFHNAACLYVRLGEIDEAIRMCAGAVLYQYEKLPLLLADTDLEVLWTDERYRAIVAPGVERAALRAAYAALPPIPSCERDAELEAAIEAEPDAPGPYLVYADWLQERGDPRGELITLSHAESALFAGHLAKHRRALLGELAIDTTSHDGRFQTLDLTWHMGFIRRARLRYAAYSMEDRHLPPLAELVPLLFGSVAGRFLREFALGVPEPGESHRAALRALFAEPRPLIRALQLCDFEYPEDSELSWVELDEITPLWDTMPNLEELVIQAGGFSLGTIVAPRLRDFRIYTSGLPRENLRAIAEGALPALERLDVWFGSETYGSTATVDDLAPLLDAARFAKVRHLALANAEFTNALCAVLPEASILPQLRVLDLSRGTMTSEGLAALLDGRDRFAHLDVLDLSDNHLIGELDPEVATLAKQVIVGDQREPFDDGELYVAIGE